MPREKIKRRRVVKGQMAFSTNFLKGIACKRFTCGVMYTATFIPEILKTTLE